MGNKETGKAMDKRNRNEQQANKDKWTGIWRKASHSYIQRKK